MVTTRNKNGFLLLLSLVIILVGSILAWSIDTLGGSVAVNLVHFVGENGDVLHGRLYVPDGVTNQTPAPAVLVIHGGDASSDKFSMYSVEFARRGYVVFNFDQRGHGFSGGVGFDLSKGFGGPEALHFLYNLDIVDSNKIAMVGHSMGGIAIGVAAQKYPDYYSSLTFIGSSPPTTGDSPALRNVCVICGLDDGGRRNPATITPIFGVNTISAVQEDTIYGSIADGTARIIHYPNTVHNAEYIHLPSIAYAIDWVQKTITAPRYIKPGNQIWLWRYLGTTIALAGAVFFMLQLGALLLKTPFFKEIAEPLPEFKGATGKGWWRTAVITAVFAPATLFFFHNLTAISTRLWPYNRITGIMGWSVLVAVCTIIIYLITRYIFKAGNQEATMYNYGLAWEDKRVKWGKIGKSLLLAVVIIAATYLIVAIAYHTFKIDFRMWNEGIRLMTLGRVWDVLKYVIPFMLAYIVFAANLHGLLRPKNGNASFGRELLINILIMAPWYYLWAIWWGPFSYLRNNPAGPSFAQGFMLYWFWALPPIMLMWTVISTYFFRKTGKVYVGAFLNAFFVCWGILAEQMVTAGFLV